MTSGRIFSRRQTLQLTGAGLLVGACSSTTHADTSSPKAIGQAMPSPLTLPSEPQSTPHKDSVGIAIIGLGSYALRQMMPAMLRTDKCHIAGVVSGNRDKALRVGRAYGVPEDAIYSYDNFDQIASDDRIDAVYIILPSGLHAEWAEKSFAAGKHVLCEKPMALSVSECDRMILAGQKANRKLMIGYRCHFEPYNLAAMKLMQDKAIGDIEWIGTKQQYKMGPTSPSQNWRVARALAGGGALEDYGIYGLQSALYLSNELPSRIAARTTTPPNDPRFVEIPATVTSKLDFPSGAVAELNTSYDAPGVNETIVRGTAGELMMNPGTVYEGNTLTLVRNGKREDFSLGSSSIQFELMMDHFADAVTKETPILVGGDMGRRDVRIIEAIYASAKST